MQVSSGRCFIILVCAIGTLFALAAEENSLNSLLSLPVWDPTISNPTSHGQFVFRDAENDEIVIVAPDSATDRDPMIYRYQPQNQVEPSIEARVTKIDAGRYRYEYVVHNGAAAKQAIVQWGLAGPGPVSKLSLKHRNWHSARSERTIVTQRYLSAVETGEFLMWLSDSGMEIRPGSTMAAFTIESDFKPGITTAYVQGGNPLIVKSGLPAPAVQQLLPFMTWAAKNRAAYTIGPRYGPSTSREELARNVCKDVQNLLRQHILVDEDRFYNELVQSLTMCAERGGTGCIGASIQSMPSSSTDRFRESLSEALRRELN